MTTIKNIPEEIICMILSIDSISIQDFIHFSLTCKHFRDMIEDNDIFWRKKFYQSWPDLKKICKIVIDKKVISEDYKELLKARMKCKNKLRHFLAKMNEKNYYSYDDYEPSTNKITISFRNEFPFNVYVDEEELNLLFDPNETIYILDYKFFENELERLCEEELENGHKYKLTDTYYGKKLFRFMKWYHLKNVWQKLKNLSAEQQLLEDVLNFIIEWYYHIPEDVYMFYWDFRKQLTNVPQIVMLRLKSEHPNHPILLISHEQFSFWKYNNIAEDQWDYSDGKQILEIICEILCPYVYLVNFEVIGCRQIPDYIRERIFTNHRTKFVIEEKLNILLAVLFQSISRKFGIRCDLISPPGCHSLLIWKPKYSITNLDNEQCFYIQLIWEDNNSPDNCPKICEVPKCSIEYYNTCNRINSVQLVQKFINCFKEIINVFDLNVDAYMYVFELQHLIRPDDVSIIMKLSEYYEKRRRSLSILITALKKIDCSHGCTTATLAKINLCNYLIPSYHEQLTERLRMYGKQREPKKRKEQMKFAVGMIVRITSSEGVQAGVISGWMELMYFSDMQLYYVILCEDETVKCIFEDYLDKIQTPTLINNEEIGRFFCEFRDTYYMPNNMLAKEYPEDVLYLTNEL